MMVIELLFHRGILNFFSIVVFAAIVIAHIPEGSQQGNGNKAVNVIAEYLESMSM